MINNIIINRIWAIPNSETFKVPPIRQFVLKYLKDSNISIDPFARNEKLATYTNDLNPNTDAQHHLDCIDFLNLMIEQKIRADLVIFDPPYSAAQIKACHNDTLCMAERKI